MAQPFSWSSADILKATNAVLMCGDPQRTFKGIAIDSRTIGPGQVFIAIKGENHDGHRFVNEVVTKGAAGVVIDSRRTAQIDPNDLQARGISCFAVADTTSALGQMAAFNRRRSRIKVVGITGSNGKTTTREITRAVMDQRYRTLTPMGNYNNEIGLPLTLLRLTPRHQWAVLEMGMNHPGEIARLAEISAPHIGVITNIGPAHLEGVGTIEGVRDAKGELLGKIRSSGTAVLNADDPLVMQLAGNVKTKLVTFGTTQDAAIRAEEIQTTAAGSQFVLHLHDQPVKVQLHIPGGFMVANALAAAAVGYLGGLSAEQIKTGLAAARPVKGRMNVAKIGDDIHLIDDTYNANPASMKAALQILRTLRGTRRSAVVAGDMKELGAAAVQLHREIGACAAQAGIKRLYCCGELAKAVAEGALEAGMPAADVVAGTHAEIVTDLLHWLQPGDWVLVKGSRAMAMETVVQDLQRRLAPEQA